MQGQDLFSTKGH